MNVDIYFQQDENFEVTLRQMMEDQALNDNSPLEVDQVDDFTFADLLDYHDTVVYDA